MPSNDTIAAIATPAGVGGVAMVRMSGADALTIALKHLSVGSLQPHRAIHCRFADLDDGIATYYPRGYTGDPTVEFTCHGSLYVQQALLQALLDSGARLAEPGEFTRRAFLNGRLNLSQAEAVADLIASSNQATHQLAMSQLRGGISTQLSSLREQLLKLTSLLELELDFSDHEDLEFADRTELTDIANKINKHITQLSHSFEVGQAIKQGIPVAIIGKTNVGKSTLLNRLLREDRAIVSNIHGTTRDTIEDTIDLQGVTFRFIDTAGIRQTTDQVEQIGIERTFAAIDKARIVIWMVDEKPTQEELAKINKLTENKQLIIVRNKIDKAESEPFTIVKIPLIEISAKHNQHIDQLEQAIYQAANIPALSDADIIVTNARHHEALCRAQAHLQRVIDGLHQQVSGDLLSEDLRLTLDTLAEITGGQITPNEVLGNIFKNFCVGK